MMKSIQLVPLRTCLLLSLLLSVLFFACKRTDNLHGKYKVSLDFSQSGIPPNDSVMQALSLVDMQMDFANDNTIINTVKIGAAANTDELTYTLKTDSITITDKNKTSITYHLRRQDNELILHSKGRVLRLTPLE